jgi:YHS domain-containing protein
VRNLITFTLALGLASGVALVAQSVAPQSRAPESETEVALDGYCPVAYVEMKQAVKGDPAHSTVRDGKTYHFANADAKKMFEKSPARYEVAYDGLCATAVAQNMKMESDPKLFTVHDGRTYLFSTADAKAMFDANKAGTIARADANWPKLASQS